MSSGWLGAQRRFDETFFGAGASNNLTSELGVAGTNLEETPVYEAIAKTRDWLVAQQHADGYWVGELEGDTILESEYILLLTWLGHGDSEEVRRAAIHCVSLLQPT